MMKSFAIFVAGLLTLAQNAAAHPTTASLTQEEFAFIKRAAGFSLGSYAECKEIMGAKVIKVISNVAHGFVLQDDANKEIIVAMRGTNSLEDFDIDADAIKTPYTMPGSEGCGPECTAHEGFHNTAKAAYDDMFTAVKAAKEQNKDYKILVTGHSLGGAECSLLALPLRRTWKDDVRAVCLGSPRFASPELATFHESFFPQGTFYRVTSTNDGVPRVLGTELGFHHVGREYWIQKEPAQGPADVMVCASDENKNCNDQYGPPDEDLGVNEAHLHYIVSFENPTCDGGKGVPDPVDVTVNDK